MSGLRNLLSTLSSSSTSAAESDEKSAKEKGLCFKVYIHLIILKYLNLRRIQESCKHLIYNDVWIREPWICFCECINGK